jgi:DNA-binding NarL/FixJ family response regulator
VAYLKEPTRLNSIRHSDLSACSSERSWQPISAKHVPLSDAISDLARRSHIEMTRPHSSAESEEPRQALTFGLTERELAVLKLLGEGKTNSEIGAELFISRKTASVYVTNILRKLRVNSRVQAAAVAAQAGLLTITETKDR